jgi:adenosine deaminase
MHGVRAIEDEEVVEHLTERQICLDVCPTSNLMLSVYRSIDEHPLPALLRAGVPCSLNADDPLLFGVSVLDEYELCRSELNMTDETLANVARWSIACSSAPRDLADSALEHIDDWLASPGEDLVPT